jgi:CheY-like chemotaxis protein
MPVRKVLVVDDDPDIRRIVELSLARVGGLEVVAATSGAEALEVAARERPDVVLLDLSMPEMDGRDALASLRTAPETASIPVVFFTAAGGGAEAAALIALGARGVIEKPFDPMKLASQLRRVLGEP